MLCVYVCTCNESNFCESNVISALNRQVRGFLLFVLQKCNESCTAAG
jgi:hypothetical protein